MAGLIIIFFLLAASFLILRKVCLSSREGEESPTQVFLLGLVSWFFLLSAGAWIVFGFYLVFELFNRDIGAMYTLVFYVMITAITFFSNETLDSGAVLFHIRQSAFFRPLRPKTMIVQEELDKKKIRDVHKETSDKPFPTIGKNKRVLTDAEAAQFRQQMQAASARPARSIHYDAELKALKSGSTTVLADPWKVYTFNHKLNELYDEMSGLSLNPQTRLLHFRLNIPGATAMAVKDPLFLFPLKQDLYQLLQVLNTDPWLAWYNEFFDRMSATCFGIESDSFGHVQMYPFLKIEISRAQLTQREGKFFNAADLHTISTLTFDNGKSLSGEL